MRETGVKRSRVLWLVAVLLTLFSAAWQRRTGPTYPYTAKLTLEGQAFRFSLPRAHAGAGDEIIRLEIQDTLVAGMLVWRRYPSTEAWKREPLRRQGKWLVAQLPHQPPAGKLEYQIQLQRGSSTAMLSEKPVIIRFRGEVPAGVLLAHVLAMFLFMLFSNRAGLGALVRENKAVVYGRWGFGFLFVGGFVLGPMVQHYAFGQWWTGFPFGLDLTDNKTLVAAIAWLWALWRSRRYSAGRGALLLAAAITLLVFLIPHSMWGSELKWEELPQSTTSP